MKDSLDVRDVARHFQFHGEVSSFAPHGNGHINDTYLITCRASNGPARYILQHINRKVFHDPAAVMRNIERVTAHLAAQAVGESASVRRTLRLIPACDGKNWHVDEAGETWRAYPLIENARTYETATSAGQAFQAARAFGRFQQQLADLPAPRLLDTIPDFHHTPKRFTALEQAIAADAASRAGLVQPEIEFALSRQSITGVLLGAGLPERITHNDTKFNNVLLDDTTGEAVCVIDLDTVMPGLALYDFGDMVRTTTSPADEDERDLSKVTMQFPLFEALVRGYIESAGGFLTAAERQYIAFSGKLITLEIGIRFLADHLAGDTYFKVHREGHNLDRCRTQFKLVESIEMQEEKMNRLVESLG
ncbi:N-acetylhexosamine 1-kinase [Candidatus Sulfotelmatomonas gaucii]|uniref:N-acetylhexosamine 1-kinase n=1 Tax=Candidatus Sulfuritelmatomonas gaucii TaxID=2043161 RepID=A0A2N9L396_9BACT|nr:N-acetylhexosamine 1-kinase [Candidatus Sulfotelmatomonas gaucii]